MFSIIEVLLKQSALNHACDGFQFGFVQGRGLLERAVGLLYLPQHHQLPALLDCVVCVQGFSLAAFVDYSSQVLDYL